MRQLMKFNYANVVGINQWVTSIKKSVFILLLFKKQYFFFEMLSTESWNSFKKINQNGSESKPICPRQKTPTTGEFL
jgi:hypothetical protein